MQICDFKIFEYQLPLTQPLTLRSETLNQRQGYLICVADAKGLTAWGEAAIFPGHPTLGNAKNILAQLKELQAKIPGQSLPAHLEHLDGKFAKWLSEFSISSSVRMAFETAVLTLLAESHHLSLCQILKSNYQQELPVNALLLDSQDQMILNEADKFLEQGYQSFKLKVGRRKIEEDIKLVQQLTQLINGRALLRLDANKAWDLKDALYFSNNIDYCAIEYIEEPLKDYTEIPQYYDESAIPVAVDETLLVHPLKEIKSLSGVEIIILKPTICGGLEKSKQLIEEAESYGLRPIISSIFESDLGIRALTHFAGCYTKHTSAGLDTLRWFAQTLTKPPINFSRGRCHLADWPTLNLHIDHSLLREK